jgi:hypothetical protein
MYVKQYRMKKKEENNFLRDKVKSMCMLGSIIMENIGRTKKLVYEIERKSNNICTAHFVTIVD